VTRPLPSFHWLLPLLLLTACATQPVQIKDLTPPRAEPIRAIHSTERPLVALALGSGGERGFAHIGVIKALEAAHIPVDIVVGTSAGSLVGALYAGGYHAKELEQLAMELETGSLNDISISRQGYIRGERLQNFINRSLNDRSIEDLDKPFAAIATELARGNAVAFNRGNTGLAVRASSSIPGMFQPANIDGVDYVDGDLKDPVPVSIAQKMGASIVIAVDISQKPGDSPEPTGIIDTLTQSIRIMRQSIVNNELAKAQVVIRPAIGVTPDIDTSSKQWLIQAGERAGNAALPQIRELLARRSHPQP
jgi:NTE family protein